MKKYKASPDNCGGCMLGRILQLRPASSGGGESELRDRRIDEVHVYVNMYVCRLNRSTDMMQCNIE